MIWERGKGWATTHTRLFAYTGGSVLIAMWTLLRFFTQRTIFDLVGQQVLAGQLLHGNITGASIGVTNYIPKIFLLYVPLHLLPGSPRLKLILLTVVVNVATLVLLGLVIEKLLREFGVKVGGMLYVAVVWLAAIAGSVFWIQFTNSRNLEVVGGVFLLYLGIRYLNRPRKRLLAAIACLAAALFFADTLQLYMTASPLTLYAFTVSRNRQALQSAGWLAGGVVAGFVGSKVLFTLFGHVLSIHFLHNDASNASVSVHGLAQGAFGSAKALVHLYAGGADAGKVRELVNIAFILAILAVCLDNLRRKLLPTKLLLFVGYILAVNVAIYTLSGQAQQVSTERYLIMTAPALVLLFGSLRIEPRTYRTAGITIVCLLALINTASLGKSLLVSDHHFSQDSHLASVERYVAQHHNVLPYASMDSSIPTAYLYGSSDRAPVPLNCSGTNVFKDSTFYSVTTYQRREARQQGTVAIVLDGTAISNVPDVCDELHITRQLGPPKAVTATDDGSIVLLYSTGVRAHLHY